MIAQRSAALPVLQSDHGWVLIATRQAAGACGRPDPNPDAVGQPDRPAPAGPASAPEAGRQTRARPHSRRVPPDTGAITGQTMPMIRAYSQRLLPPFSGMVQIAESAQARAQSFDGVSWQFQYLPGTPQAGAGPRVRGYGLDRGYYNVAALQDHALRMFVIPACLDATAVRESVEELFAFLADARVPFPPADRHEYWLLDAADESPLALIYACCDASLIDKYPNQTEWTPLPHSKMQVANTAGEQARREPPVNHRLQRSIARRAGNRPRAAWFERSGAAGDDFPSLLLREDWAQEADHDLCQRYLMRMAPRLLMLQGLSHADRERLELAARAQVFEVEAYFPLYPEINDEQRMAAMRVEAQLRRAMPQRPAARPETTEQQDTTLSKQQRIFET